MTQQTLFQISTTPKPVLDTRAKALEKVKPNIKELRIRLLKSFYSGEWNADAWAEANNLSILSVRPRVSELNKAKLLHRVAFGLTIDGNLQDKFTLYPIYRDQMANLIEKVGLDKAAERMVEHYVK